MSDYKDLKKLVSSEYDIVLKHSLKSKITCSDDDTLNIIVNLRPSLDSVIQAVYAASNALIKDNTINYYAYDAVMSYFILTTFTDLQLADENGEPDIALAYSIDKEFGVREYLCQTSVGEYIFDFEKGSWRQLDLYKNTLLNDKAENLIDVVSEIITEFSSNFRFMKELIGVDAQDMSIDKIKEILGYPSN